MTFASHTKVSVEQTRAEIERTLARYGAKSFAYATEEGRAAIMFNAADRRIRFDLPLPPNDEKHAQLRRSKWRALLLCIKAKLESVASKIETFEEAFMAQVVLPDGMTVGQHAKPMIAQAYKTGIIPPLLPAPTPNQDTPHV